MSSDNATATPKRRPHRKHRPIPIEARAYYTRREVCARFGFSAKRLAEAIASDDTLPMIRNGRNQLFPKAAIDAWYESAASSRQNVHKA